MPLCVHVNDYMNILTQLAIPVNIFMVLIAAALLSTDIALG